MPVTAPRQELLKKIDRLLNRGTKVTLVQGNSSVQLTGDALTALRQIFAALNAGPLSLLIGDSRDTELTSQEAADLLNVSRPYIVKLAREGTIPHTRVGNRHRFLLSDIEEHGRRQRVEREQALASMSPEGGYSDGDF
jgi:excisionase family DNA binding protein